jgi:hypothetical protein
MTRRSAWRFAALVVDDGGDTQPGDGSEKTPAVACMQEFDTTLDSDASRASDRRKCSWGRIHYDVANLRTTGMNRSRPLSKQT